MLPNFMIVGAPKAGTTSLYHYLAMHPEVFLSIPKELNYFSCEEIESQGLYYDSYLVRTRQEYERHFECAEGKTAVGEASVSYLYYPSVPKKIHGMIPDVKIIILLRDPVERAFSHYLMDFRLGLVDASFEDVVCSEGKEGRLRLHYQQYVELGCYGEQVERYLETFGREQALVLFQEDLKARRHGVLGRLCEFLEISPLSSLDVSREHNVFSMPRNRLVKAVYASSSFRSALRGMMPRAWRNRLKDVLMRKGSKPKMDEDTRSYLRRFYQGDIERLEALLECDLAAWKAESVK